MTARLLITSGLAVMGDQFSKAWAVWALGRDLELSLPGFLLRYFTLFNTGDGSTLLAVCGPFPERRIEVLGRWLQLELTLNTGAAWNLLSGNSFALSFLSFAFAGLALYVWRNWFRTGPRAAVLFGLVIGGTIGNGIDRFRLREVVDFLKLRLPAGGGAPWQFPYFNLADVAVTAGILILIGYLAWIVFHPTRTRRHATATGGAPAFTGGLHLDDAALEDLQYLDTTTLRPYRDTPAQRAAEQEEIGRLRQARILAEAAAAEVPELISDLPFRARGASAERRDTFWNSSDDPELAGRE